MYEGVEGVNHTQKEKGSVLAAADDNSRGQLLFLKTPLETRTRNPLVDVYILPVPVKLASSTLDLVRKLLPDESGLDLQHLRRFAKFENLPESVRASYTTSRNASTTDNESDFSNDRILIVGPINSIAEQAIVDALSSTLPAISLSSTPVPLLAPISQEQATSWTAEYWPTVYKKTNPFGPHFTVVAKAEADIRDGVDKWMDLAEEVAKEASTMGSGEQVGVVIVERKDGITRQLVAAGDARWYEWPRNSPGNATAHAALRGIAMVAEGLRLREETEKGIPPSTEPDTASIFRDEPIGRIERENHHPSTSEDGYLCHDLEIYCTHEPCVMCSMAIVHSRFGKVVFTRRMSKTGGMCADGELGHGLFWRKELNWTLLAWQWCRNGNASDDEVDTLLNA